MLPRQMATDPVHYSGEMGDGAYKTTGRSAGGILQKLYEIVKHVFLRILNLALALERGCPSVSVSMREGDIKKSS